MPKYEDILKAVIEAQVNGGCERFADYLCLAIDEKIDWKNVTKSCDEDSILRIILDTDGCKAAYGEEMLSGSPRWMHISAMIHNAWHSKKGNNWKEALVTAHTSLPKK